MDLHQRQFVAEKVIQELLQLLENSYQLNLQIDTFSTLGAYLLSNGEHRSVIIKYVPLYHKILQCLTRGPSLQHVIILNFVAALLYIDADEGPTQKKALSIHAQNMIRASGCLSAMCDLFVACMMHQETWRALCRSLAEVCRDSVINQNFCAHLVPLCVQKSQRGDTDAIVVLQSLLTNHQTNNKLFHINNGMSIFTRDMMQDLSCLELLNTVIENLAPDFIDHILQAQHIFQVLRNFTLSRGCCLQVIQWKTIIFYSCERVLGKRGIALPEKQKARLQNVDIENRKEGDETQHLFQNIIREVRNFHFNEKGKHQEGKEYSMPHTKIINGHSRSEPSFRKKISNRKTHLKQLPPKSLFAKNKEDLSFSFLLNINTTSLEKNIPQSVPQINRRSTSDIINNDRNIYYVNRATNTTTDSNNLVMNNSILMKESEIDFNPVHASTPKRKHSSQGNATESKSQHNSDTTLRKRTKNYVGVNPRNMSKVNNRLSSKLKDVVNQSCTTIVKSFKNLFKLNSHKNNNEEALNKISYFHNDTCSYSFTNYMKKRDNFFAAEPSAFDTEKGLTNLTPCTTCNDTLELKEKMLFDPRLKETVKKLKLGINIFGCDFKKISRTFWPNEKYMTPTLLYSLYRKLIDKR